MPADNNAIRRQRPRLAMWRPTAVAAAVVVASLAGSGGRTVRAAAQEGEPLPVRVEQRATAGQWVTFSLLVPAGGAVVDFEADVTMPEGSKPAAVALWIEGPGPGDRRGTWLVLDRSEEGVRVAVPPGTLVDRRTATATGKRGVALGSLLRLPAGEAQFVLAVHGEAGTTGTLTLRAAPDLEASPARRGDGTFLYRSADMYGGICLQGGTGEAFVRANARCQVEEQSSTDVYAWFADVDFGTVPVPSLLEYDTPSRAGQGGTDGAYYVHDGPGRYRFRVVDAAAGDSPPALTVVGAKVPARP